MRTADFIKLGWHTVPLKNKLERLENGKKTIPIFPYDWLSRYTNEKNKEDSDISSVITGKISNIIALDCDNANTYAIFKALDPNNKFFFDSVGKDGGTIIYKYDDRLDSNFNVVADGLELNFYSNRGAVFLPTDFNKCKKTFIIMPKICEIPDSVFAVLARFHKSVKTTEKLAEVKNKNYQHLAPLVESFVVNEGYFVEALFKVITPYDFRSYEQYIEKGFLHPKFVYTGNRNNYLMRVSAILGADESINTDLYNSAMCYINALLEKPLSQLDLDRKIIAPMLEKRTKVDGKILWIYNKHWSENRCVLKTKNYSSIEVVYDHKRQQYFTVDLAEEEVKVFEKEGELRTHVTSFTGTALKRDNMLSKLALVSVVTQPNLPFGFQPVAHAKDIRHLNMFKPSEALRVFYNPEIYKNKYVEPQIMLKFLETLIPNTEMRTYLLSFLKTKLKTLNYSPVVLLFLGVSGSGKSLLVSVLKKIVGNIHSPSSKLFLEKYNNWLLDSLFIELDEFGDSLTKHEKNQALGLIKSISGAAEKDVRLMKTNSKIIKHNITIIMTSNKNPLILDMDDRRMAVFKTPNNLLQEKWVKDFGGVSKLQKELIRTVNDFCYFLSVHVPDMNEDNYVQPPELADKFEVIVDSLPATKKIIYSFKYGKIDYLANLCRSVEHNLEHLAKRLESGEVSIDELDELHESLAEGYTSKKSLIRGLKDEASVELAYVDGSLTALNFKK